MNQPSVAQDGVDPPLSVEGADEEAQALASRPRRRGFLPIVTNWFDRLFIGIYLFVAIELFWMRFIEKALPLAGAHILALVLGVLIVWRG